MRLLALCMAIVLVLPSAAWGAARQVSASPAVQAHAAAMGLAREALRLYKNGQFAQAAAAYRRAAAIEPHVPEYLFGAARAEQQAGHADEAADAYLAVLKNTPNSHPLHARADKLLRDLRRPEPKPPTPAPAASEPPPLPAPATPSAEPAAGEVAAAQGPIVEPPPVVQRKVAVARPDLTRRAVGWGALATAGIAAAGAALLAGSANSAQSELAGLTLADGRYDLSRISYDGARERQQRINDRWVIAGVLSGMSVAAAVVGAYLVATGRAPALTLQPDASLAIHW